MDWPDCAAYGGSAIMGGTVMGSTTHGRFDRHARTFFAVFVVGLVIGGLAVAETVLSALPDAQVARAGERPFAPPRELVLREYQPNARFAFAAPAIRQAYPGDRPARAVYALDTDADGFILPARNPARGPERQATTVVFLGGSTTEAMYVDPENRFPHRVGQLLEQRLGIPVDGLNAGRSGNNSLHATLLLTGKVLPLRPNVVVLMEAVNDLGVLASHGSYWTASRDLGPVRTPRVGIESAVQPLRDASVPHTWRAIKRAIAAAKSAPSGAVGGAAQSPSSPSSDQVQLWADAYGSLLRQFVSTARAWQVEPVLMTQARLPATDEAGRFVPDVLAAAHEAFNVRLRSVAVADRVPLIDLAAGRAWTRHELYDGLHFNDTGSLAAADIIAAALETVLRLSRVRARD